MSESRDIRCEATVLIHVRDDAPADWLRRVVTDEFPYWHTSGARFSEDDGLRMLCDNALRNGVDDASRLDGWADLEHGAVTLEVLNVDSLDLDA